MSKREYTVGELVDASYRLREQRKELDAKVRELKRREETVKEELMAKLDQQGIRKAEGTLATASINKAIFPRIEDFDTFFLKEVVRHKDPTLLERRVSATRYRELLEERGKRGVAGLEPFEKATLSLRKL